MLQEIIGPAQDVLIAYLVFSIFLVWLWLTQHQPIASRSCTLCQAPFRRCDQKAWCKCKMVTLHVGVAFLKPRRQRTVYSNKCWALKTCTHTLYLWLYNGTPTSKNEIKCMENKSYTMQASNVRMNVHWKRYHYQ